MSEQISKKMYHLTNFWVTAEVKVEITNCMQIEKPEHFIQNIWDMNKT